MLERVSFLLMGEIECSTGSGAERNYGAFDTGAFGESVSLEDGYQ